MADASNPGLPSSSTPPSAAVSSSRLTKSALTAHDRACAAVASSSASPSHRPYTPAAGLTSRRYSTPGLQRMTMTIPISPPPSVSGRSLNPSSASPQSPVGGSGYTMPMTPSASTVSGQSRRASLTSSQSVAHAYGFTTATTSTPSRYFPLPSPVDPSVRAPHASAVPKVPTPMDTIQEVSSSGSGTNSRSGSTVARGGGGPPTPNGSVHSRSRSISNPSAVSSKNGSPNSHRPSTSKASYFHWQPGATPLSIYDPDYPNGSPECLSPRRLSSATPSSTDEAQARDYFSQPIRRHSHEERSSPRHRQHRPHSNSAKTLVSASPPLKDKDCLPPTPGDVISITPSPPTSTKCDTPHSDEFETPLSLSEFTLSNNRMGSLDSIFGPVILPQDDKGRPQFGGVPWTEMPQYIRRHNREVERRQKEREKTLAKDKEAKEVKRREKMTVTEARLIAGEWKLMEDIPPTLELIQRAGREEEKRMCVRIDGTVELTGIGFLRDLPFEEQKRLLTERSELDKWLRGDVKEKPKFLLEEMAAYEKRLEAKGKENLPIEGRIVELIEAPPSPPKVVVTLAPTELGKLASVAEVDESTGTPNNEPAERRPASPAGT